MTDAVKRLCAHCGKKLKASEVAANWNNEWFACLPCWDESDGFLGWPAEAPVRTP